MIINLTKGELFMKFLLAIIVSLIGAYLGIVISNSTALSYIIGMATITLIFIINDGI